MIVLLAVLVILIVVIALALVAYVALTGETGVHAGPGSWSSTRHEPGRHRPIPSV